MHPWATAALGEEFQGLRGPAVAEGGGRSDQGGWRRQGGERRWMSSGWVVGQVGGAPMTDGDGGGVRVRKREKKEREKHLYGNKRAAWCLVTSIQRGRSQEPTLLTWPWAWPTALPLRLRAIRRRFSAPLISSSPAGGWRSCDQSRFSIKVRRTTLPMMHHTCRITC